LLSQLYTQSRVVGAGPVSAAWGPLFHCHAESSESNKLMIMRPFAWLFLGIGRRRATWRSAMPIAGGPVNIGTSITDGITAMAAIG